MFLGREPRRGLLVDQRGMVRETAALLAELGIDFIDPEARVGSLSVAQQQIVEIVKALSVDARVIQMDEPTAALADHEVELLYAIVRRSRERGVTILYVSHRLREIFELCDDITVLKDGGARIERSRMSELTPTSWCAAWWAARSRRSSPTRSQAPRWARCASSCAAPATTTSTGSTSRFARARSLGSPACRDRAAPSSSRVPSARCRSCAVEMFVDGTALRPRDPRQAVRADSRSSPRTARPRTRSRPVGARQRAARYPGCLPGAHPACTSGGAGRAVVASEVTFRGARPGGAVPLRRQPAEGGARPSGSPHEPRVVLLDEPTRGIDVGAKIAVYQLCANSRRMEWLS